MILKKYAKLCKMHNGELAYKKYVLCVRLPVIRQFFFNPVCNADEVFALS